MQHHYAPYLANELGPADQAVVAAHLRHCAACATALVNFLQELRAIAGLLGGLPLHPAPLVLRERLLAIPDREAAGGTSMPELKQLRGVRVQEYYEDEALQDAAEDERQVPTHGIVLVDHREGRAPPGAEGPPGEH